MATCPTVESFRSRFSEFSEASYAEALVSTALDDACAEMDSTVWGDLYARGACCLAAHMLAIGGQVGGGERVVSRSIGDVSVSFGDIADSTTPLASTRYGAEYLRLRSLVGRGPVVLS